MHEGLKGLQVTVKIFKENWYYDCIGANWSFLSPKSGFFLKICSLDYS